LTPKENWGNEMTDQEYIEMYNEFCIEGNSQPTVDGFAEFVAWRKRVEKFFQEKTEKGN